MEDWNGLRLVLAIQRAGALTAAAETLDIDHSTAFRRLKTLEERLGVRLFERLPGGRYSPTEAGARIVAGAERMEEEALALHRDLSGRDHRLCGRLRVTASETLAFGRLPPHLAAFRQRFPGVVVELHVDNRVLSLARREADIALRPVRPREGELWGRRLADVRWALYGHGSVATPLSPTSRRRPRTEPERLELLSRSPMIGWEEGPSPTHTAQWLDAHLPTSSVVYRTNSLVSQLQATRAGIGLALLPCYLGDPQSDIARILPEPFAELDGELWIVTHADLKRTARIRAFFETVGEGLAGERDLFEGRRPVATSAVAITTPLPSDKPAVAGRRSPRPR